VGIQMRKKIKIKIHKNNHIDKLKTLKNIYLIEK